MNVASVWLQRHVQTAAKVWRRQNGKAWLNGTAKVIGKRSGQKVRGTSDRNAAKMKKAANAASE